MKKLIIMLLALAILITGCETGETTISLSDLLTDDTSSTVGTEEPVTGETTSPVVETVSEIDVEEILSNYNGNFIYEESMASDYDLSAALENVMTITTTGVYVYQGTFTESITVNAPDQDVTILLNGVTINASTGPAINVVDADDVTITLLDGTVNSLSDSATRTTETEELSATIYSTADTVINGTGTLIVTGNFNNGIQSKDDLIIVDATIEVDSVDDGIIGKDMLTLHNATITVEAEGDGLKSTNDEDLERGIIYITSSTILINAGSDGIQAENSILIESGSITVDAVGKGIKANYDLYVVDGTFNISSIDDALNFDQNIVIDGGTFVLATTDDGVKAQNTLTVNGGSILVTEAYEGLEAQYILINGGVIDVTTSDDGLNAASDYSSNELIINGGTITVMSGGDSLDVNGYAEMNGGTVILYGPYYNENSTLDTDQQFVLNGGTLIAFGNSMMAHGPGTNSVQNSITYTSSSYIANGSTVTITDENGNVILEATTKTQFNHLVLSSEDLVLNESYTLTTAIGSIDYTQSSVVTYLNDSGVTTATEGTFGAQPSGQRPPKSH